MSQWTLCIKHLCIITSGGTCKKCNGDKNLIEVVPLELFQIAQNENYTWRRCYLDKPEDRLYHASDNTWWQRKDNTWIGIGGLYGAPPPLVVQAMELEIQKLKASVERLKRKLAKK